MEEMDLVPDKYHLILASLSLPFVKKDKINDVLQDIYQALVPGGIFAGQLFGDRHQWIEDQDKIFFKVDEARSLFRKQGFVFEAFQDSAKTTQTALDGKAFWHEYIIIARKPNI